jgi:predicted porin
MKKTLIALALASAMGTASADATVYGSVEQRLVKENGAWTSASDDNFIGFRANEDLGNGASAYAEISMDMASESGSNATVRDSFVGINFGSVNVQAGRQINFLDAADDATTDIFEGTSLTADGADRADSAVRVMGSVGGVTLGGVAIVDAGGEDTYDAYQLMASANVGPATVLGVYNKNETTGDDTTLFGASANVANLYLAGTYEIAANDDVTMSAVASLAAGNNTVKAGIEDVENGVQTYVVEGVHNFSKNTSAYVNYSDTDADNSEAVTMVGMRVNF